MRIMESCASCAWLNSKMRILPISNYIDYFGWKDIIEKIKCYDVWKMIELITWWLEVRWAICLFFTVIWCRVLILRSDHIKNPCVELLVKNSKVTLPLYIYFGVLEQPYNFNNKNICNFMQEKDFLRL